MVLATALAGCNQGARFTRTGQADFVEVRNEYTLVLLRPSFLQAALGSNWESQTLYLNPPTFSPECELITGLRPFRPLAKGDPVLTLGCTGWETGTALLYSVENGSTVALRINLRAHRIQADPPVKPNGPPRFLADGGLVFN